MDSDYVKAARRVRRIHSAAIASEQSERSSVKVDWERAFSDAKQLSLDVYEVE